MLVHSIDMLFIMLRGEDGISGPWAIHRMFALSTVHGVCCPRHRKGVEFTDTRICCVSSHCPCYFRIGDMVFILVAVEFTARFRCCPPPVAEYYAHALWVLLVHVPVIVDWCYVVDAHVVVLHCADSGHFAATAASPTCRGEPWPWPWLARPVVLHTPPSP